MAVDDRRDRGVVERVVRSALELSSRQLVLLHVAVDRRRVFACLLQVARHVEHRVGTVPVADDAVGVHVAEQTRLHDVPHVYENVRTFLVGLVEDREVGEERLVCVVGDGDPGDLRQDVLLDPVVGDLRVRQPTDEAGHLDAILVVDESADGERLAPQPIGLGVEREELLHDNCPFLPMEGHEIRSLAVCLLPFRFSDRKEPKKGEGFCATFEGTKCNPWTAH